LIAIRIVIPEKLIIITEQAGSGRIKGWLLVLNERWFRE